MSASKIRQQLEKFLGPEITSDWLCVREFTYSYSNAPNTIQWDKIYPDNALKALITLASDLDSRVPSKKEIKTANLINDGESFDELILHQNFSSRLEFSNLDVNAESSGLYSRIAYEDGSDLEKLAIGLSFCMHFYRLINEHKMKTEVVLTVRNQRGDLGIARIFVSAEQVEMNWIIKEF